MRRRALLLALVILLLLPDTVARGLASVALALAIGALAAVVAGRPWRAFEADDAGLPPVG